MTLTPCLCLDFVDIRQRARMRREVRIRNRQRQRPTDEFKAEAVQLVREGSMTVTQVARDLDLTESSLRN
ncbi:MAG: transposase [Acidobacteria bacterium]|nr:transposase [Acidobacteriota bacterium]